MITSMSNGVSALTAFQKALDVESNNAANTGTMGFKSDSVSFSDMMYDRQVGMGTSMNSPTKNFSQGQLQPTNNEYDFSLKGDGFFTVAAPQDPSVLYYTRAGHFSSDVNNNMVDENGMLVLGVLPTISGDKITSEYETRLATSIAEDGTTVVSTNTFSTDYTKTAISTGTTGQNYKTANANINDIDALATAYQTALTAYSIDPKIGEIASTHIDTVTFPKILGTGDAYTVELVIDGIKFQQDFDTSMENTLSLLSDSINEYTGITSSVDTATGVMTIESIVPGQKITVSQAKLNEENVLIDTTNQESGTGQNLVDAIYDKLKALIEVNGGQIATTRSEITKATSGTLVNQQPIILDLDQLGMSDEWYGELENDDGNLYLTQGDARFLVGQLTPVIFPDNSGLQPEGNNLYSKSDASGNPVYLEGVNEVVNGYLEASNVDLSDQLVQLLTFQKAFEANSKSITTSDELMKTALALKNS